MSVAQRTLGLFIADVKNATSPEAGLVTGILRSQ